LGSSFPGEKRVGLGKKKREKRAVRNGKGEISEKVPRRSRKNVKMVNCRRLKGLKKPPSIDSQSRGKKEVREKRANSQSRLGRTKKDRKT